MTGRHRRTFFIGKEVRRSPRSGPATTAGNCHETTRVLRAAVRWRPSHPGSNAPVAGLRFAMMPAVPIADGWPDVQAWIDAGRSVFVARARRVPPGADYECRRGAGAGRPFRAAGRAGDHLGRKLARLEDAAASPGQDRSNAGSS